MRAYSVRKKKKKVLNTLVIKIQPSNTFYWVVSKLSLTEFYHDTGEEERHFHITYIFKHSASVCADLCLANFGHSYIFFDQIVFVFF